MKKVGRNDPCPCGSGKKFKKCCEAKMLGGRFMATKIETPEALSQKTANLTGFFQSKVAHIAKVSDATRSLKPKPETPFEEKPKELPLDEPPPEESNKEIEP